MLIQLLLAASKSVGHNKLGVIAMRQAEHVHEGPGHKRIIVIVCLNC